MNKTTAMITALVLGMCLAVASANVQWSRLRGKVKNVNGKTSQVTIQNKEGDLLTVKVDEDVEILVGKDVKRLRDVSIDEKVTLVYSPKAPAPKEEDVPDASGIYPPIKR